MVEEEPEVHDAGEFGADSCDELCGVAACAGGVPADAEGEGGITIIGELLSTLLTAVSATANVAAFLLLPKLSTSPPAFSFSAADRTG